MTLNWLRTKLSEFFRNTLDALTAVIVIVVLVAAIIGSFIWVLLPWHQRKVREAEAAAAAKAALDKAAKDLEAELAADRARREAEATYKETAVKADAQRRLGGDPVDVANDIIRGRR